MSEKGLLKITIEMELWADPSLYPDNWCAQDVLDYEVENAESYVPDMGSAYHNVNIEGEFVSLPDHCQYLSDPFTYVPKDKRP